MRVGELLAVGRTADVHAFGAGRVVKVPRPSTPSHWAALEAELSTVAHAHGLPAPGVVDVVTIEDRDAIVFERVDGPSMWQVMQDRPSDTSALIAELVAVQRMIHASGIPDDVPDLVARLRAKVSVCFAIGKAERDEAAAAVETLPRGAALLHGDLHPGNVLMGPDGPVVIDWFDAAIGHPTADVVRSSLLLWLGFEGIGRRRQSPETRALLDEAYSCYADTWRSTIDLDDGAPDEWQPLLALARISEQADEETAPLLELWNRRPVFSN